MDEEIKVFIAKVFNFFSKTWDVIKTPVVRHVIVVVITGFITSYFPTILIVAYMAHYHFFSYDLLSSQSSESLYVVSSTLWFVILVVSFGVFSWLFMLIQGKHSFAEKNKAKPVVFWSIWAASILISFVFISWLIHDIVIDDGKPLLAVFIIWFALSIVLTYAFIFKAIMEKGKFAKYAFFVCVVFLSFILSVVPFRSAAIEAVSVAFKIFNIGGDVCVSVCEKVEHYSDKKQCFQGQLLLLTPKNVYMNTRLNHRYSTVEKYREHADGADETNVKDNANFKDFAYGAYKKSCVVRSKGRVQTLPVDKFELIETER